MKVAFVAVNYNNWHISSNYVASVKAIKDYTLHDISIVIVDNCSSADDFANLKREIEYMDDVILVRTDENLGYFGGLNYGIKQIDYCSFDYVVAGNNDLFFTRDFLNSLSQKTYKEDQVVIVPDVMTINGVHQNPQFVDCPNKARVLAYSVYYSCYFLALIIDFIYGTSRVRRLENKKIKTDESIEIFQCTGAVLIMKPSFFRTCGLLDDSLFLWGEEVALAHQLKMSNRKLLYDPDLVVIHMESASVSKVASYKKYKIWQESFKKYKKWYTSK